MRRIATIAIITAFYTGSGWAQDCKVIPGPISVSYEGECKNGKANGKGKATGLDTYEGDFVAGYPEGKGKYTWKTGDWYEGTWKKGAREGNGEMHYKQDLKADSVLTGIWKKDQYVGKFEKPYKIISQSSKVGTVKVTRNIGYKEHDITITIESTTGGSHVLSPNSISSLPADALADIPLMKLTAVDVQKGNFNSQTNMDNSAKTSKSIIRTVEFPFRAIFRIADTHSVEIEFLEEGNFQIDISILN